MKYIFTVITVVFYGLATQAQPKTDKFLTDLFAQSTNPTFQKVIKDPSTYRLQIIYTQINRDKNNTPHFKHYYFNVDSLLYFNPASTVKLPLALLSLEKINQLNIPNLNKFTPIQFDSSFSGQTKKYTDATSPNGLPSIAHFIKKAFLVSDNDAYNRMYEFVGQQTINRNLHAKGYKDARITHRFVRLTPEENSRTNPVRFLKKDGTLLYAQPAAYNQDAFDFSRVEKLGKAHYNFKDSLVNEPFDFSRRNRLPLKPLHQILLSVMFPQAVPVSQRFNLTADDYQFLYQYLSQFPRETNYPKYDEKQYYDSYVKFFFLDSLHHTLPEGVRVFNKVGWAYGFLTDASYVADFKNNIEYMLSATIYVNSDGILNDNKYDFETVGQPFMYELGQLIYQYELQRKRSIKPDLSRFKVKYEVRQPDNRPTIKDVEN